MAPPSSATPAATAARRRVFETVLRDQSLHGSEELATLPTPTMAGADPNAETLSANVNQNRSGEPHAMLNVTVIDDDHVTTGNHRSSGPAMAEEGNLTEAGNTPIIPVSEWTHAQVVAFLEARHISRQGTRLVIEDQWTGTLLLDVIEDDQVHTSLRDELGIDSRLKRLTLIRAIKDTMASIKPAAEHSNNEPSTGMIQLLPGENT